MSALVESAHEAQAEYERTGRLILVPAAERTEENTVPGTDYYTNADRGLIPQWDNTFNMASWSNWVAFDAHAAAKAIDQPLMIIHSDSAVSPDSVREFITKVPNYVEQLWLPNVAQFNFYDQAGPMNIAANAVADHFLHRGAPTPA